MNYSLAPILWVMLTLPILLFLQRWIHRHLRGMMYLLTGDKVWSLALYALVMLPGVFLHEFSHWFMANVLGVRTGSFSIWPQESKEGIQLGYVEYYRDKHVGAFRESLIGAAPLIFGTIAVILIGYVALDLPDILGLAQVANVDSLSQAWVQMINTDDFLLWLYLLFAISNAMMPSPSDRRAWPGFVMFVTVITLFIYFLGWTPLLVENIVGFVAQLCSYLSIAFTLTIVIDLVGMVFIAGLEGLIGRIRQKKITY